MPGNIDPIYSKVGFNGTPLAVTAANTSSQGGGTIATDIWLIWTSDATNGGFCQGVQFSLAESTIATASTATVGRVFWSTVTSGATASTDTHLIAEVALVTQTPSSTLAGVPIWIPINKAFDAGVTILVTNHAAPVANTHWKALPFGGKY